MILSPESPESVKLYANVMWWQILSVRLHVYIWGCFLNNNFVLNQNAAMLTSQSNNQHEKRRMLCVWGDMQVGWAACASRARPSSSSPSDENLESIIYETGTIKEVSKALVRWSTDAEISQDDEDCHSELQPGEKVCRNWGEGSKCPSSWYSGEACVAAAGIANAIVDNFEYPDAEDIT